MVLVAQPVVLYYYLELGWSCVQNRLACYGEIMCVAIHSSNKKDIGIVVFYLKVWITLLNEMLQLLFVPRRHLFPASRARLVRLHNTVAGRQAGICSGSVLGWLHLFKWIS